jgi:uncharacterized membrane protein YdjX (TVP38/TMEM64 family)
MPIASIPEPQLSRSSRRVRSVALAVLCVLCALCSAAFVVIDGADIEEGARRLLHFFGNYPAIGPVCFVFAYVLTCILLIPGFLLTYGAGIVFGFTLGAMCVSLGVTAGAAAAFLLGRYLMREWVARQLVRYPRLLALEEAASRQGWRIVLWARLCPFIPFRLCNYAFGISRISFWSFIGATMIGTLPGVLLYVSVGCMLGEMRRVGLAEAISSPLFGVYLMIVVVLFVFSTLLTRRAEHEV